MASAASVVLLVAGLSVAPAPAAAPSLNAEPMLTQHALRCEPPTFGRDQMTVVCALEATVPRRIRVKVHITGSHDDTTASLEVTLAGAPVACDAGSKTRTEGEDGDVVLDCRFDTNGKGGEPTALRASAKWFHAQYVGFEVGEPKR